MRVAVTIDHRFTRTPDGAIWTRTSFTKDFWQRYLSAFDRVLVIARIQQVEKSADNWTRCDGDDILFAPVPYYVGIMQYIQKALQVRKSVTSMVAPSDAVIIRIHGQLSSCLRPMLRKSGRPYAAEVIGDPYSVLATGQIKHPLRYLLKWWLPRRMREQSEGASAVAYVTKRTLQRLYPANSNAFTTYYSSIVLNEDSFAKEARQYGTLRQKPLHLIIVCTLNDWTKGPNLLIEAAARGLKNGIDLRLTVVGGGKHQQELEDQSKLLGIRDLIRFKGWLPAGKAIYDQLDRSDLFVLPSYQEGVSRSTIEAMARALPCITTNVGGMPEILPAEDMVPSGDVDALTRKILEVGADSSRMTRMSANNLITAQQFREDVLSKRWATFYSYVRRQTEEWLEIQNL